MYLFTAFCIFACKVILPVRVDLDFVFFFAAKFKLFDPNTCLAADAETWFSQTGCVRSQLVKATVAMYLCYTVAMQYICVVNS